MAPLRLAPGFWPTLRGVWLLTWRTQCTARGLGRLLLSLVALPLLAYLVGTPLPRRPNLIASPEADVVRFAHNLGRHGMPLSTDQSNQLSVIFNEEYARLQKNPCFTVQPLAQLAKML